MKIYDCIIIGGGQAGLSMAYFLRRYKLNFLILEEQNKAGGAWVHTWDSLKLFSPVPYSSLSGWQMPQGKEEYPNKDQFIDYLTAYEARYGFNIQRSTEVLQVKKMDSIFALESNNGIFYSKTIVSATGTAKNPYIPPYKNRNLFKGKQMHSLDYKNTKGLEGKKVLVVGGGNSGAQILAEVSKVAECKWITIETPYFLPEEIDGRYLFNEATKSFHDRNSGNSVNKEKSKISLNNIVQVEAVKEGLARNIYQHSSPFEEFYDQGVVWTDATKETFDAVIWCTGFRAELKHLNKLGITKNGRIETKGSRSIKEPQLWLLGYGNWTGFASATIYGVGKTARQAALEINAYLNN